jgi:alpha-glucosidase (family GH31 glycosyl hydrolase)
MKIRRAATHLAFVFLLCSWVRGIGCLSTSAQMFTDVFAEHHETTAPEEAYNPVADPKAVVLVGHARFTVLTPQLIRMEWSANGKFEDHPSFVFLNRRLTVPEFTVKRDSQSIILDTGALRLTYNATGANDGRFSPDNITVRFSLDKKEIVWNPGVSDNENLQGTTRTLDGALGSSTKEPIGDGLISRAGWSLVDDTTRPLFDSNDFTFAHGEQGQWPWVMLRPTGDRQDWYFFGYGHDYKKALYDYVRIAGRIPLPPQFAFGTWWSRYWAYSDQELDSIVQGFRDNRLPLDVLVIDMDWHLNKSQLLAIGETDQSGHDLGWSGYTWNPLLFPDPQTFLANVHREGLKTTLNLHPASGVQPWESPYPAMARAMGIDPASRKYVPFDITSKKFATNYMNILHHPLEHEGVDFWWLDWQQEPNTGTPGVNPTWWLNYVHFTDQEREGKRPLLFHRWGGLGNHRYQIGFSGDTISVWPSLAFQPWFTATAANVGYAYWSHDIGGHQPGAVDPELYTRWVQFGAFSPILRTHTSKNPGSERRIWAYPEPYSSIMRDTFQERYAFQPYLYTEGRRTYDTGLAFFHPLYYDWPEIDAAYDNKGEYIFGSQMIVAPVVAPVDSQTQLVQESIWIPEGDWIEAPTGRNFRGPAQVVRNFSIDQIPVYLRAGAIVPRQLPMEYTGQKPIDPLILRIYPLNNGQASIYRLYADSGKSEAYKRGVCTWTKISSTQHSDDLTVEIAPIQGSYSGMIASRTYQLELPADWPPDTVIVNGAHLRFIGKQGQTSGWRYEGNTLMTVVDTPRFSVHERVRIEVRRKSGSLASRSELNGFAGAITRLHGAYDALNALSPIAWSPNVLIDAWQTGDRMSYRPQTARQEIERFSNVYMQSASEVKSLNEVLGSSPGVIKGENRPRSEKEGTEDRRIYIKRAIAMIDDGKPL